MIKTKMAAMILCLALVATGSFAGGPALAQGSEEIHLSPYIFPDTLEGLPLVDVSEADAETAFGFDIPIREGYGALYGDEDKMIVVCVFLGHSEASIAAEVDEIVRAGPSEISAINDEFAGLIEFHPIDQVQVRGHSCPSITYEVDAEWDWEAVSIDGRLMVMGAGSYMIIVHIMSGVGDPGLSQTKRIVETFHDELPHASPTPTPTKKPTPTPTSTLDPEIVALLSQIDEAEVATLSAVLWHVNSIYHTAAKSKIRFGFMVGQLMEMYDVDVGELRELLGPALWEKLDYAYDLDKINSLRSYCKDSDFSRFSDKYEECAERKVREEFSFDEAQDRITKGFEDLRTSVRTGEMDDYIYELEMILVQFPDLLEYERIGHADSMAWSQEAARVVTECAGIINKLTGLASRLFGASIDKAKIASALSLVWAQDQVRYWTTAAYLWGGTEKLRDNLLERLREQFNLFERQEFHYGPVFAAEGALEKVAKGIPID